LPDPDPPAMPMMKGFIARRLVPVSAANSRRRL